MGMQEELFVFFQPFCVHDVRRLRTTGGGERSSGAWVPEGVH